MALNKDEPVIRFHVDVDNHALDHRLCVLFDTGIASKVSLSDQQFGTIERPTELTQELEWWSNEHWEEKPITIEPMQSFTSLRDEAYSVALLTDCVREYQITGRLHNDCVYALPLFRKKWGKKTSFTVQAVHLVKKLWRHLTLRRKVHYRSRLVCTIARTQSARTLSTACQTVYHPCSMLRAGRLLNGRLIFSLSR
ncbi:glycoside hydrolase family 38 C-terminal domain-containing protein [Bacillus sp. SL00103]